jgi:hypothetical protein
VVALLTNAELDFLLQNSNFTTTQQRYIRYKLRRKIKQFFGSELPLLMDKGYISNGGVDSMVAANSCGVAVGSHAREQEDNNNNNERVGRGRFGLPIPAMSRRYHNQARPPAQYTMKKFVAQYML